MHTGLIDSRTHITQLVYMKTVYHMHANKFHIIHMPKSGFFLNQYHEFLFFLAYYLYAFPWDRALISLLGCLIFRI